MAVKPIPYEEVLEEMLRDPEVRKAYDALEPIYQVISLRVRRGLTQKQLAERVGTTQSSIARLESGASLPRLSFLQRVVDALDGKLTVTIVPAEEAAPRAEEPAPAQAAERPAAYVTDPENEAQP